MNDWIWKMVLNNPKKNIHRAFAIPSRALTFSNFKWRFIVHITFFQSNLTKFFSSNWCYAHQNPKEVMNPSNSTIYAKLQAQETKPLELQLLTKNTHTMYSQATTLLEWNMFFVEWLLEIHIWSSISQKSEVCWLKKNGCWMNVVFMMLELQIQLECN